MQFPDTIHPSMESSVGNCCTAILVTILCFAFSRLLTHPYFAKYSALFVQSPTTLIAVHDRVVAIIIAPNYRLLARESLLVFTALCVDGALYMYYILHHIVIGSSSFLRRNKSMVAIFPSQYPKRVVFVFQFKNYPFGVYFIRRLQLWCNDP